MPEWEHGHTPDGRPTGRIYIGQLVLVIANDSLGELRAGKALPYFLGRVYHRGDLVNTVYAVEAPTFVNAQFALLGYVEGYHHQLAFEAHVAFAELLVARCSDA